MFSLVKSIGRNFIGIALIVAALIVGGYVIGKFESVRHTFFPNQVIVETSRTIINNLQGMGQLVTVKAEVAKTDVKISINRGFLKLWTL